MIPWFIREVSTCFFRGRNYGFDKLLTITPHNEAVLMSRCKQFLYRPRLVPLLSAYPRSCLTNKFGLKSDSSLLTNRSRELFFFFCKLSRFSALKFKTQFSYIRFLYWALERNIVQKHLRTSIISRYEWNLEMKQYKLKFLIEKIIIY